MEQIILEYVTTYAPVFLMVLGYFNKLLRTIFEPELPLLYEEIEDDTNV